MFQSILDGVENFFFLKCLNYIWQRVQNILGRNLTLSNVIYDLNQDKDESLNLYTVVGKSSLYLEIE